MNEDGERPEAERAVPGPEMDGPSIYKHRISHGGNRTGSPVGRLSSIGLKPVGESLSTTKATNKMNPIGQMATDLGGNLEELFAQVNMLEDDLLPVLANHPRDPMDEMPTLGDSGLYNNLKLKNDIVLELIDRIRFIRNRIEL